MSYGLGAQQLALLQIAYIDAKNSASVYGRYARAYELLFSMISDDGTGATWRS